MPKLIDREWSKCLKACRNTWLSDDGSDIPADFDPDGAEGSMILIIATGATLVKNTAGKWQKLGTTEVIT